MSSKTLSLASFVAACLLTAGTWVLCWPEAPDVAVHREEKPPEPPQPRLERSRIPGLVSELENATSNEARLKAATELENISIEDFPGIFDSVELMRDRSLTQAGKALLIRWASVDGKAAAEWSWMRLRGEGMWTAALREIAPAWAWHDPSGLAAWTLAMTPDRKAGEGTKSTTEVLQTDTPIFETLDFDIISKALIKEDPRAAFTIFLTCSGWIDSEQWKAKSFTRAEDIREAVLAFDKLEEMKIDRILTPGNRDHLAMTLLQRWKELDPADFARSPYAIVLDSAVPQGQVISATEWKKLPPEERASGAMKQIAAYKGNTRTATAGVIAASWALSDPAGCRMWVESLPEDLQAPAAAAAAGFGARSDLGQTLEWAEQLPASSRAGSIVAAFESWNAANPQGQPDTSNWPEQRRQAWEDLAALKMLQSN